MISIPPETSTNLNYTSSVIKRYWCHICKKEFQKIYLENIDIQCNTCGQTFVEELETQDETQENHPSHFRPFDASTEQRNTNRLNHTNFTRVTRPRTTGHLLDLIISYFSSVNYEDDLENIINQIMMNDTNKYGNPPASVKALESLEKFKIDENRIKALGIENTCAVCKDEFIPGIECLKMPCSHLFHSDCILPWLKERNSCPVCRFELPTDDEDFENRKKAKNAVNH